jgi:hypothetical protein
MFSGEAAPGQDLETTYIQQALETSIFQTSQGDNGMSYEIKLKIVNTGASDATDIQASFVIYPRYNGQLLGFNEEIDLSDLQRRLTDLNVSLTDQQKSAVDRIVQTNSSRRTRTQ